jgi:hypothetical protein
MIDREVGLRGEGSQFAGITAQKFCKRGIFKQDNL